MTRSTYEWFILSAFDRVKQNQVLGQRQVPFHLPVLCAIVGLSYSIFSFEIVTLLEVLSD